MSLWLICHDKVISSRATFVYVHWLWLSLAALTVHHSAACTCPGESHPGPVRSNSSYIGRSAPEIDVFEALITSPIYRTRSFMSGLHQEFWDASLASKRWFSTQTHWAKGTHPLSRWLAFYVAHQNPHRCRPHHCDAAILSLALLDTLVQSCRCQNVSFSFWN